MQIKDLIENIARHPAAFIDSCILSDIVDEVLYVKIITDVHMFFVNSNTVGK